MVIGWVRTAIRFTICEPAPWDVSHTIPSGLYNCRESSTNHTFLCKTKPIFKKPKFTQTLLQKHLTKIFATFGNEKTKPIQSQTKPICKMPKMDANYLKQRDYEKNACWKPKKNKANSKPISKASKNQRKLSINKGL